MHDAMLVSQIILWIVVLALSAVVFALVRQIGVLPERTLPMGAPPMYKGPKVGDKSPVFQLTDLAHRPLAFGAERSDGRSQLLIFVSPTCPVCKKVLPIVKSVAGAESRWLDLIFTSDGEAPEQDGFVRKHQLESFPFVPSSELGMAYRISKLPYAVLIDGEGVVRAKGLVNTREHLDSIVAAKQIRIASSQEYLKTRHVHAHDHEPEPQLVNGERGGKHG